MPVLDFSGPKGLTASDRSTADKQYLNQISGGTATTPTQVQAPSYNFNVNVDSNYIDLKQVAAQNLRSELAQKQLAYNKFLKDYQEKLHVGWGGENSKVPLDIRNLANKVSNWYKEYKNSDKITLTDKDWTEIAAQYQAINDAYGTEQANAYLDGTIQDNVGSNQSWYEQAWNGFRGMGASLAGALIGGVGMVKGAADYFDGNYKDNPDLNAWDNFMNSFLDNNVTRYGNDIVQYGAWMPENIAKQKETGISALQIVETREQQESLLSSASPWIAMQSSGFTVASMLTGGALAKGASWLFKGLGTAAKAYKAGEALTGALTTLQKANTAVGEFLIPGLVGTVEGASEGLNTKIQMEEDGLKALQQVHQQEVGAEVNRRLGQYDQVEVKDSTDGNKLKTKYRDKKTGELYDIDQIYQQVWNEYSPKYNESLRQIDYAATKAGINNFYINSIINGLINSTLKAGLQAAPVKGALSKSKIFGWVHPKPTLNITGEGAATTVTSKFGVAKQAWNMIKEPLGEFGEEYAQSISDATMRGGAENNIHQFIDNKYKGDGSAAVGDSFSSDWGAAWSTLTESAFDKETIKSGIYGAISSIFGTPFIGRKAKTGRTVDGKDETTFFGRGLNEKGELESNWERLRRITPWRSGLLQAHRKSQIQKHQSEEAAQALQEWLRDPDNKDKFDGLVGTFNWAKAMGDASLGSDEFGYRNSALGKTINDAFMLQKLKGTKYYDAFLNQLTEVANLEEGSELAEKYISAMKDDVNVSTEDQSDEEILKTLKSNANKMLSTLDNIQQESKRVDKLLGNVDNDTKQSLIFGQMMRKDWQQRDQKINEELANIKIENSVNHSSTLDAKQKEILAEYNSIAEAKKRQAEMQKTLSSIKEDIKNLSSRKNLTDKEKSILKSKKVKSKSLEKELKRLDAINDIEEGSSEVLSEEEIMNLDPISRAIMLRRGKQKTYVATHGGREEYNRRVDELNTRLESLNEQKSKYIKDNGKVKKGHNKQVKEIESNISKTQKELDAVKAEEKPFYSEEQQAVIDNLVNQGTAQDENFLDKVIDAGRIKNSIESFDAEYQAMLGNPDNFNDYVFNAKQAAADIASKRKYQAMSNIQDYATFAREMDKMYNESSLREQSLISNAFKGKDNENFERYKKERQMLYDLIEQVSSSEEHKNMSDNDKEMFAHTITYLSDKGVDFNNNQEVVDALAETDENGISEFKKYVEEVNSTIPETEQTAFTSIGEAIQNFNDVMATYNKENAQREANEAPIEVAPTTPEQSAPTASPEPVVQEGATETKTKSIFDIAGSSTPEGGYIAKDGSVISNEDMPTETAQTETVGNQPTNNATSTEERNPIIQAFADNSNEDVAKAAEIAINVAKNQPNTDSNVKNDVRQFIESLSKNSFESVEDFAEALISSANTRETNSENGTDSRASLLRQVAAKVNAAKVSEQSITEKKKFKSPLLDKKRQQLDNTNRQLNSNYNMFPNANSGSSFIASVNIDNIRQRFPNSPTIKYYEKYNIEEALRDGILDNNPDIFFITDEEFSNATKQDMESNGYTYNPEVSMPIIAVVESKNGPVVIGDKKYQPISVMASTNHIKSAGSTHMAPIRNAAQSNTGTQLISINGKPIVTKIFGKPKAYSADINYRGRNNVIDVAINDLYQDERNSLVSQNKQQRRRNPAYQKAKRNFLRRLGTKMVDGRKALVFNQPNLQGKFNPIEIFTSPINESTARNSDNTFEQEVELADGDIINFNSRTRRASRELEHFLKSFTPDDLVFNEVNGQIIPTEATAKALQTMASNLQKEIDNFINVPIKNGWIYRIVPTSNIKDGNRLMDLNLVNTNTNQVIPLTTFHKGMSTEDIKSCQEDFLKNLILSEDGRVRMANDKDSFAKWNVPYSDTVQASENRVAANNISDIYEDGILGAAATTFNYRIQGIAVQNPFKADGTPAFTETANAVNAQPQQPVTTPTIAEGQVKSGNSIATDDGVILEGKPSTPTNKAKEIAASRATKIEEDSKHIKLADDNSGYIDTRTGKFLARVTSIISADERAGGRFDPNSPWVVPSTNIGTGFDEFVRDFFAGKLDNITTSPIATQLWNHLQNIGLSVHGSGEMQEFLKTHNLQLVQQAIESPEVQKEMDEIKKKAVSDGTFMKAPNGKPTNLNERQWLQVRTKAFKDWFGDWENNPSEASKVVDENGEPLVVYHNTPFEFNGIFDMDHKSRIMPWTSEPFGHVGTQETANTIKGTQFALFLNVKNPLETPDFVHETVSSMLSELYKQGIISREKYSSLRGISNSELRDLMLSLGYDGTKYENKAEKGGTSYSFITPNQIKSATDNVGTFSRTNNDITTYTTPQGEVYGFVDKEGNVYLDETKISPEHPIHEYTHLWDRIVQQKNSKLWNRGVELMKQTTLWNEILNSEHYGKAWQQLGINGKKLDNLIASEVHARLTGTEGETLLKELANKKGQSNIISKLKDWLLDIWKTLGETFGTWSKEDLDNLTLEDFNHLTIRDFTKGYNPVNNTFQDKVSNNVVTELSEKYPNATEEALQKFRGELVGLRNNFIANGLTVIPRDVTVTGSLDVLDSNNKVHTVDVAGTLDLLAYDGEGNFYIFDMKTNRSGIDKHKQEKYSRQLSLYKKFLESKYGIQVKSLNLIPIGVEYPAPAGWRNGSADYSVSPEKPNQLMIDGKNYTGANPTLQEIIAVNYTEPHIVWEKMTDEERAMFGEVENTVKAETNDEAKPTEAIPSEPSTETVDPILGTPFNDSYLGDMFNVDSEDLNNLNMDFTERTTPIPEKYQWNNLTQEQREGIEMQGFNETSWSSLEDEEMEHKLKCLGL